MLIAQMQLNYHGAASQNKLLETAQLHTTTLSKLPLFCFYSNSQCDHVCKAFLEKSSPVGELLQFVD